jgi:hypothetical protein
MLSHSQIIKAYIYIYITYFIYIFIIQLSTGDATNQLQSNIKFTLNRCLVSTATGCSFWCTPCAGLLLWYSTLCLTKNDHDVNRKRAHLWCRWHVFKSYTHCVWLQTPFGWKTELVFRDRTGWTCTCVRRAVDCV